MTMTNRKPAGKQRGTTVVEFAIAGTVFFMILFAAIEMARMMFARSVLEEGVRRGARLAAVCPLAEAETIKGRAAFTAGGDPLLPGFGPANLQLQYLNAAGAALGDPAGNFNNIRYVRVTVQNYTMPLLIPFMSVIFQPNGMSSTLPRESLGVAAEGFTTCA
jgi:hypothetical protein